MSEDSNNLPIEKLSLSDREEIGKNLPPLPDSDDESCSSYDEDQISSDTRTRRAIEGLENSIQYIKPESEAEKPEENEVEKTEKKMERQILPSVEAIREEDYDEEQEDDGASQEHLPVEHRRYLYIDYLDFTLPKFSKEERIREGQIHWYLREIVVRKKKACVFDLWGDLRKKLDEYAPVMERVADVEKFVIEHPHCFNYKDGYLVSNKSTGTWMYFPSVIHLIHSKSRGRRDSVCLAEIFLFLRQLPDSIEKAALAEDLYFWEGKRPANCKDMLSMLFLKYPTLFEIHEIPAERVIDEEEVEELPNNYPEKYLLTKQHMGRVKKKDFSRKKRIFIKLKPLVYTIPSFWCDDTLQEFDKVYHVDKSRQYGLSGTIVAVVKDMVVVQIDCGFLDGLRALGKIEKIGISLEEQKMLALETHIGVNIVRNHEGEHGLKILQARLDRRSRGILRSNLKVRCTNTTLSPRSIFF